MKAGAFQAFHRDVLLTPPRYSHHSESSSPHLSVTTQYCQAYVRVSMGLTVSRKTAKKLSH